MATFDLIFRFFKAMILLRERVPECCMLVCFFLVMPFALDCLTCLYQQYLEIWAVDEKDPFTRPDGGESVDDVASRLASAVETMESEYEG